MKFDKEAYIKKLRTIENEIISNVKDIVHREKELSIQEFTNNLKSINLTAWEKSEQLIKV